MLNDNKIKLLLSSPYRCKVGGISRWTEHVLKYYNIIKENSKIELIQYYPGGIGAYQNTSLLMRLYKGIVRYLPYLKGIKYKLDNDDFDIVHFVSSASLSLIRDLLAIKMSKKRGVKAIVHFRFGRIPELYNKRNWEQKILHKVIIKVDKVIVIDMLSYNTLLNEGYRNVELLPNPLTSEINEIIEKNRNIKRVDNKILFAGHCVVTKGIFELIAACKSINGINLKIIGYVTSDIRRKLIEHAGFGHEKWLEIAGEKNFETTIKEMLSAGIFVLPSYTEGFPNVIIESMACACPIITTRVGAIPEMLDTNNGIVIDPMDIEQLKAAILNMLDNRPYAIQCGLNAQLRVNELYSMPKVWEKMEKIWKSLI